MSTHKVTDHSIGNDQRSIHILNRETGQRYQIQTYKFQGRRSIVLSANASVIVIGYEDIEELIDQMELAKELLEQ